jgi:hypothetical protein
VLIAGGCTSNSCELDDRGRTTELFDADRGRFRAGPPLPRSRVGHAAVRLRDGSVLVVGGWDAPEPTATAELYEPGRGFSRLPSMTTPRGAFTATLLPDGRVLIAGGTNGDRTLRRAELFDPRSRTFRLPGRCTSGGRPTLRPRCAEAAYW